MASIQESLLNQLACRGDVLSIERGLLKIIPASGIEPPEDWLQDNSEILICEIVKSVGCDAYRFVSYSTGKYGKHKAAGVTLQLGNILTGESAYVIFNADLTRARGAKNGQSLPAKQFRVGKQSHFYKFWISTGLKLPPRLSRFHDYMGNIRRLVLTCEGPGERKGAGSLRPLNVSAELLNRSILPSNIRPTSVQHPSKIRTTIPHSDLAQTHATKGIQQDTTTGHPNHEYKVVRVHGDKGKSIPSVRPQEQSVEEWLADYQDASGEASCR